MLNVVTANAARQAVINQRSTHLAEGEVAKVLIYKTMGSPTLALNFNGLFFMSLITSYHTLALLCLILNLQSKSSGRWKLWALKTQ